MGGFGSGRWGLHDKATAVEDCRAIDLAVVTRGRAVAAGLAGVLTWTRAGLVASQVGYKVIPRPGGGLAVEFGYRWTPRWPAGDPQDVRLAVPLEPARVPRGGVRWWGRCPLAVGGVACGRRVGRLYLPPGGRLFGCRRCHRLAYRSSQEHDRRVDALVADPAALERIARGRRRADIPKLGLALKALTLMQRRLDRDAARVERSARRPRERRTTP